MAPNGRPPKPLEQHKRNGTLRADRHGSAALAVVPAADAQLVGVNGSVAAILDAVLDRGVHWLAATDAPSIGLLRDLLEERDALRAAVLAGNGDRKQLRDLDKQVMSLLSQLGFDPAARTRLGLGTVELESKLDQIRRKKRT